MAEPDLTSQVPVRWRKASYSGNNGTCVEVAQLDEFTILVRNSNHPGDGPLAFMSANVDAWIKGCKAGEFDDLAIS